MSNSIATVLTVALAFLVVGFSALFLNEEYKALKKFYPDLTFYEYCILGDKLKIIPTGN